ncbi:MAG: 50S ribosomal protein L32e [archaeon]|nr:MAG: 50S ribosomal protein L32e [archaeon]
MGMKFKRHPELVRLGKKWRKPKSRTNKVRRKLKGRKPMPVVGYGSPKTERGLHPSGMPEVLVSNIKQIEKIDKSKCIRVSGSVGNRKKMEIIKMAEKRGIKVINPKVVPPEKKPEKKEGDKQ